MDEKEGKNKIYLAKTKNTQSKNAGLQFGYLYGWPIGLFPFVCSPVSGGQLNKAVVGWAPCS